MDNKKDMAQIVTPGEQLGVIEEFIPQNNCFEEDGSVYSASWGIVHNEKKHEVSVVSKKNTYNTPIKGAISLGYVTEIRKQTSNIILSYFKGDNNKFQPVKYRYSATLHVSNISDRFIRNTHDALRPGDWVICRVTNDYPLAVSFFGSKHFGVIHAACFQCGKEIKGRRLKRNLIQCNSCGATQSRFLSFDYNNFESKETWEDIRVDTRAGPPPHRNDRRDRGGPRRDQGGPRRDQGGPRRDRGRSPQNYRENRER